jgi:hypothetical protein
MRKQKESISGDYYEKVYDIYLTCTSLFANNLPKLMSLCLLQTPSPYRFSCKTNQQQIVNDQP